VAVELVRPAGAAERAKLERKARLLAWGGNAWHLAEFAVAVGAGIAAGSIALVAFGFDSLIELASGLVVVWRFTGTRRTSKHAERVAQRSIAASYFALAAFVTVESLRDLVGRHHASTSWLGIGLAMCAAVTMPLLAAAKRDVGRRLESAATVHEGGQNQLCAYLSVALLAGLGLNAAFGWWWADPVAALAIAGLAAREGVESLHGDDCC
jgi:divalent metal cation (Fe/Co/Zn/Cd) transporter